MARVGFKKHYVMSNVTAADDQALFALIKNYLINAGFNVLVDDPTTIEVVRAGHTSGALDDDVPQWVIKYVQGVPAPYNSINAGAVFGINHLDAAAQSQTSTIYISLARYAGIYSDAEVWFAADGAEGWWWLNFMAIDPATSSPIANLFNASGVSSRRYASDTYSGISARYGLLRLVNWNPAYAIDNSGYTSPGFTTSTWTPIGSPSKRHAGSPLPRMAAPLFPNNSDDDISACVYGEFDAIMAITDGYQLGETVMPGWVALPDVGMAVKSPATFDIL